MTWKNRTMSLMIALNYKIYLRDSLRLDLLNDNLWFKPLLNHRVFVICITCKLRGMHFHLCFPLSSLHKTRLLMHAELEFPRTNSHMHIFISLYHTTSFFGICLHSFGSQYRYWGGLFISLSLSENGTLLFDHSNMKAAYWDSIPTPPPPN